VVRNREKEMPVHGELENFIPFRRRELVDLCASDGALGDEDSRGFLTLAELIFALYHHEFHGRLEQLKDDFAPFDPDADVRTVRGAGVREREEKLKRLVGGLKEVLVQANYRQVSQAEIEHALAEKSLIKLNLRVDFEEFEEMLLFKRGSRTRIVETREGLPFFKKTVKHDVETFERVVLLLRYRGEDYYRAQRRDPEKLPFRPGRLYVQLFKDIPRADLEFLFPNMRAGLSLRQGLFLIVPALGAGIPVLIKVGLSAAALVTALSIFLGLKKGGSAQAMAGAVAGLTALAALGGYLFKQYAKYKSTLTKFLKGITEQLFFKNLDSNSGVFRTVIDEAEEEEGKEALLAYYHLLVAGEPLDAETLDRRIEAWFAEKLDAKLDFEVDDAVAKLERLGVIETVNGQHRAKPIPEALRVVDRTWDGLYSFD
jgi:hypothetical protein